MPRFRCIAMDDISTDAGERHRATPGARPVIVVAVDEDDAVDKSVAKFAHLSHDFIKVDRVAS